VLEILEEATFKEKHLGSSFLAFHACSGNHEWLILPFGIGSNMFKLLCIEVIFKYKIMFLIDDWYCHLIYNACLLFLPVDSVAIDFKGGWWLLLSPGGSVLSLGS